MLRGNLFNGFKKESTISDKFRYFSIGMNKQNYLHEKIRWYVKMRKKKKSKEKKSVDDNKKVNSIIASSSRK